MSRSRPLRSEGVTIHGRVTNDSQGLKIAVAVFIALSVILSVASYFLYSNGSVAEAKLASDHGGAEQAHRGPQSDAAEPVR